MILTVYSSQDILWLKKKTTKQNVHKRSEYFILTGTTNSQFSRIRSSVMPDPNGTKFTVEVPSTQGRPHSKFEERFLQIQAIKLSKILCFFLLFAHCKNLTHACFNLVKIWYTYWGLKRILVTNLG